MYLTYFKIAIRNFIKSRAYSIINLSGLAIGLAAVIIILSYVRYEVSYDKHYSNPERVYRLVSIKTRGNITEESVFLPEGLASVLKQEFAEVEDVTYSSRRKFNFLYNGENVTVDALTGDPAFFKVFNLPSKYGNQLTALNELDDIVITEKMANEFFPGLNPVGASLMYEGDKGKSVKTITGVIKDIPANTHFSAAVIISGRKIDKLSWAAFSSTPQYLLLKRRSSMAVLEKKLKSIYPKYGFPATIDISFQPVPSIHLHSAIPDEPFANSDIRYVYIFSSIALLILFIACINYVNLSTARSLQRVKEVGVRKVLGAGRKQLCFQLIGESFIFFCAAIPFALLIANLLWPVFAATLNIKVQDDYLLSWQNILSISLVSIISGVLSGTYPALFLSHLQPVSILKDHQKNFKVNLGIRKTLIVLQFVISVALIISTFVIYRQLQFVNTMPLGFNKDQLIILPSNSFNDFGAAFKNELKQHSGIEAATITSWNIGEYYGFSSTMDNPKDSTKEYSFHFVDGDFDFLNTMQIKLLQGRNFSPEHPIDLVNVDSLTEVKGLSGNEFIDILASRPIIISEKTVKQLELKNPIGQVFKLGALQGTVVGVAEDFYGLSLHQPGLPLVLRANNANQYGFVYVRIRPQHIKNTLEHIEITWKKFFPSVRFEYSFVDERLQKLYDAEGRLASLFTVFAILAIAIACSGLFSLVALTVQQRTKEIGIRKVLGAGIAEIVQLITKDFLLLISIAIVIASPLAWFAMNRWLESFAFRTGINWWIFLFSGLVAITIALITIIVQVISAARANPAKSLRTE
jgi:putative ABC transport system permease protein